MRLFLSAVALVAWNLAGYPLALRWAARRRAPFAPRRELPTERVTVLVAAHNEEGEIGGRVRNLLENGSQREIEVIVISDASTDRTVDEARAAGARVIEQARSGKVAALHRGVAEAAGDVIVLTDANTRFDTGALDALADPLSDARVGITAGDLVFENPGESASSAGEGSYWRYETAIKEDASRCGMLLMGAGGIYAMRREDWPPHLEADLADDSYIPLSLHRDGRVNLFISGARARERAGTKMEEEWRRRVRMVAQDVRVARQLHFGLPNARTACALISHKVLRWCLFPLAVVMLFSAPRAAREMRRRGGVWRITGEAVAALPLAAGVAAGTGAAAAAAGKRIPVVSELFYLAGATAAAFAGFCLGLTGRSRATWEKAATTRASERRSDSA